MMNKRGASNAATAKSIVWVAVIVLALIVVITSIFQLSGQGVIGKTSDNVARYVFFGQQTWDVEANVVGGEIGTIIVLLMVWLIIFAGFGDILENFSAFSSGIAWIIAFAVGVVAANTNVIQAGMKALIAVFAWLGTAAIFGALLGAIFAFFAVNWGISGLTNWLKNRQTMIHAATGRTHVTEGLKTLSKVGKTVEVEGA